jgi:hypothetical protein
LNGEGKGKSRGKLTITTFSMHQAGGDGGGGTLLLDWLRKGGRRGQLNSNLTEKIMRKIGMVGIK